VCVLADASRFAFSMLRPRAQLVAENLFLRKQLALYLERQVRPPRANNAVRLTLLGLSRLIEWRHLLIIVKPQTLIRWHRKGSGCSGDGNRGHRVDRAYRSASSS